MFSIDFDRRLTRGNQACTFYKYEKESQRLITFYDWKENGKYFIKPEDAAKACLFYTGIEDNCKCPFCKGTLKNWTIGDDAYSEHKRHFPTCPFIEGKTDQNIPLTSEQRQTWNEWKESFSLEGAYHMLKTKLSLDPRAIWNTQTSVAEHLYSITAVTVSDNAVTVSANAVTVSDNSVNVLPNPVNVSAEQEMLDEKTSIVFADVEQKLKRLREEKKNYDPWVYVEKEELMSEELEPMSKKKKEEPLPQRMKVEHHIVDKEMKSKMVESLLRMGFKKESIWATIEKKYNTTGEGFSDGFELMEAIAKLVISHF